MNTFTLPRHHEQPHVGSRLKRHAATPPPAQPLNLRGLTAPFRAHVRRAIFGFYVLISLCPTQRLSAATLYVWQDSSVNGPGTSWNNAYHAIQEAVNEAAENDTVLVTNGVYTLSSTLNISVPVTVCSVNGPADTIIDGINAVRCVQLDHANAVLQGFTIRQGYTTSNGGGVAVSTLGGTVRDCSIRECQASQGGGIFFEAGGLAERCLIAYNSANVTPKQGGGAYIQGAAALRDSLLCNNTAETGGGAFLSANGYVISCTLAANTASLAGGGYACTTGGKCYSTILYGNSAPDSPDWMDKGGSIFLCCCSTSDPGGAGNIVDNPLFVNAAGGNFRLASHSPCINTGDSGSSTLDRDLDGLPRALGYAIDIGCYERSEPPSITITPTPPETVPWNTATITLQGTANIWAYGLLCVSNSATGGRADFPVMAAWTSPSLALAIGANTLTATATNVLGEVDADSVTVTRLPPLETYVSPTGGHVAPFGRWQDAATNIQAAVDAVAPTGTVWVTNGTYWVASPVTVNKGIRLRSVNGSGPTVVDGNNASRCLVVAHTDADVCGFTFRRGYDPGSGAGIYYSVAGGRVRECQVRECRSQYGGGVFFGAAGGLLDRCTVISNRANIGNSQGGGVYIRTGVTVRSSLIWGNAASLGGGLLNYQGGLVENCTLCDNAASGAGGGVSTYDGACTLVNTILYLNSAPSASNLNGAATCSYCCVAPAQAGAGNITADPLFVARSAANYRLADGSPCLNSGGNTSVSGTLDLDGLPRILYGTVDRGCYESAGTPFVDVTTEPGSVTWDTPAATVAGTNNAWIVGYMTVSNAANGAWATFAATTPWTSPALALAMGANSLTVRGTNAVGTASSDAVTITRQVPAVTYVSPSGGSVPPYARWQDAATNIQAAVDAVASGGTVWVTNGTYALTAQVSLTKAVTLSGVSAAEDTIVDGGGTVRCLQISHASAVVQGLTFKNGYHGAVGGGIYVSVSGGIIRNCRVMGCRAEYGAGIYLSNGAGLIETSWIVSNRADVATLKQAGGVSLRIGNTMRNCLVTHNTARTGGGAMSWGGGTVVGCTISDNSATTEGGGVYAGYGGNFLNCISYDNTAPAGTNIMINGSGGTFTYCCATPAPAGTGNIGSVPLFADRPGGDYRLTAASPCLNSGNNADAAGSLDLDGIPRILDGVVDRGCYEFKGPLALDITPGDQSVPWSTSTFTVYGTCTPWAVGFIVASNTTTGSSATFPAASPWFAHSLTLAMGANVFKAYGTNELGETASDVVTITRELPVATYVSPSGGNVPPYARWQDAATNIQAAVNAVASNGTVWVTNGTYVVTAPVDVNRAVILRSVNGSAATVVDGNNGSRCLTISDTGAEVIGFTFRRGYNTTGGGIRYAVAGGLVRECVIKECHGACGGGVMFGAEGGLLERCVVISNRADISMDYQGGGIFMGNGALVRNCLILDNTAGSGGGIFSYTGGLALGCTISGNHATSMGGGIYASTQSTFLNCICYFNSAGAMDANIHAGGGKFSHCCTTPDPGGFNTITSDPLFADRAGGDYRLSAASACLNSGYYDGAVGALDLDGQPRVLFGTTDRGCYENPGTPFVDITTPAGSVSAEVATFAVTGTNNLWVTGSMTVSNAANGAWAVFAAAAPWTAPALALAMGTNTLTVTGTNAMGVAASDTVKITRLPPTVTYVSPTGGHVAPFARWPDAATNIQAAVDAVATNGTVLVTNGTYSAGLPVTVSTPITLRSVSGSAVTLVDARSVSRCLVLNHASASVAGLTLRGGFDGGGGGVYINVAGGTLRECRIVECRAQYGGGVFFAAAGGTLDRCLVTGNSADFSSEQQGGGVYIRSGVTVRNCLVTRNTAKFGAGILSYQGGSVIGCTFSDNSALNDGGGIYASSGGTYLNCVSYYNTAGSGANIFISGSGTFTYCCATPAPSGTGNIASAPLFVSPGAPAFNYRLQYGSPCIDTGTESGLAEDLDGAARPLDGNGDTVPMHDRGAYEYNPETADSNMDAIPDWWCLLYGLSPTQAELAQGNPDGDAFTTGEEWVADTSPTDGGDFLRITQLLLYPPVHSVWASRTSASRLYTLQRRERLDAGEWQDVWPEVRVPGTGGLLSLTDAYPTPERGFYKVLVERPQN